MVPLLHFFCMGPELGWNYHIKFGLILYPLHDKHCARAQLFKCLLQFLCFIVYRDLSRDALVFYLHCPIYSVSFMSQSMYIRVKRNKTTYFITCEPTETTLNIKEKLHNLIDQPVNDQRLILVGTGEILEDSKSLADQKVPFLAIFQSA